LGVDGRCGHKGGEELAARSFAAPKLDELTEQLVEALIDGHRPAHIGLYHGAAFKLR
jgi:hypothetical protein